LSDSNSAFKQKVSFAINRAAQEAGRFLLEGQQKLAQISVLEKSPNQLVSEMDVDAEKQIVQLLQEEFPHAGFITEEDTIEQKKAELSFIIDPLDGTTNFLHGLEVYSVSIGAVYQNELIAGAIYIPARNELFHSIKDQGAFLNNEAIHVSNTPQLKDSLLATGFPFYAFKEMDAYIASLSDLMKQTRGLRRMGSAAIDLAYTAQGKFCGFFELNLHPWDVAAGILLVQEAGGKVSTFNGTEGDWSGAEILATNGNLHAEFQSVLSQYFGQ